MQSQVPNTPDNRSSTPNFNGENSSSASSLPWYYGFIAIIISPYQWGKQFLYSRSHPVMVGILLSVIAAVLTSYVITSNPALVNELWTQTLRVLETATQQLPEEYRQKMLDQSWESITTFSFPTAIFEGIVNGVLGIFLPAAVLWLLYRLTTADMMFYLEVANFFGLAQSLVLLGAIINSFLISIGNSFRYTTSLLLLAEDPVQLDPATFSLLSQVELFNIWMYVAASVGVAAQLGYTLRRGIAYGLTVYGLKLALVAGFALFSSRISSVLP